MKIISLKAREILDSRGVPTVEAVLETDKGLFKASVPSGASTGAYEAFELRDNDARFFGKGVLKAIKNIEEKIAPELLGKAELGSGKEITSQKELDEILIELDGTENKTNLGANAILPVSMACCRAFACEKNQELFEFISELANRGLPSVKSTEGRPLFPAPCFNMIEGGKHAGNNLEIQEFTVAPFLDNFKENLRAGAEVYYNLKLLLIKNFGETAINTGYESGFAPALKKAEQVLDFLMEAIKQAGYEGKVKIGLDIAASELLHNGRYKINGRLIKPEKLLDYYLKLLKSYPILFLEDPFSQDDWQSWKSFRYKLQTTNYKLFVVGDDLTATNPNRIQMAKDKNLCNGVIIKLNQIGTVSEAITASNLARSFGWKIIVSHRAGETCDNFIADFTVGIGADFIKTGAPAGGERVAKYNRLLEIENQINPTNYE